jgi:hypothetical protein
MFNQIDKSKIAPIAAGDLVNGHRYLMVDTEHAVVVTAIQQQCGMAVMIARSFLVGFFAAMPNALRIDQAKDSVQFFVISEDVR